MAGSHVNATCHVAGWLLTVPLQKGILREIPGTSKSSTHALPSSPYSRAGCMWEAYGNGVGVLGVFLDVVAYSKMGLHWGLLY